MYEEAHYLRRKPQTTAGLDIQYIHSQAIFFGKSWFSYKTALIHRVATFSETLFKSFGLYLPNDMMH